MAPKKKGGAKEKKEKGEGGEKKGGKVQLAYHDEEYWNNRYTKQPEPFDWYQSYKELKPLLTMYIPKEHKNMNAGCGNGLLAEEMVKDGYLDVVCIDNSATCFDQLTARYKGKKEFAALTYFRQDMKELKMFKDLTIDNVIDKGRLHPDVDFVKVKGLVLKPQCKYIVITYGDPRVRMPWLKTPATPWESILVHVLPRPGSPKALKKSPRNILEPVYMLDDYTLGPQFNLDDPDWHYIYVCTKEKEDLSKPPPPKKKK